MIYFNTAVTVCSGLTSIITLVILLVRPIRERIMRSKKRDDALLVELAEIKEKLENHIKADDERAADAAREYILRFSAELIRDLPHSKEDFNEVLLKIDNYERYCRTHADYENNRATAAIRNVKRVYDERLEKGDFIA